MSVWQAVDSGMIPTFPFDSRVISRSGKTKTKQWNSRVFKLKIYPYDLSNGCDRVGQHHTHGMMLMLSERSVNPVTFYTHRSIYTYEVKYAELSTCAQVAEFQEIFERFNQDDLVFMLTKGAL